MSSTSSATLDSVLADDLSQWPGDSAAAALITTDGVIASSGDCEAALPWASVTKIVAALAVLDVVHDGLLDLDEPAGPPGSTVRHLLGHSSGWAFDEERVISAPGTRRIYSNVGIDAVTTLACERAGAPDHNSLLRQRVFDPAGMTSSTVNGPASHAGVGPVSDLARLAQELLVPQALRADVIEAALTPSYPELSGVLPGFGRQQPNDWGLGIELRGHKSPHWMPTGVSPLCAGHFGQAGAFLWVDRASGIGAVAATGVPFGPWAAEAWPVASQRWLDTWRDMNAGGA